MKEREDGYKRSVFSQSYLTKWTNSGIILSGNENFLFEHTSTNCDKGRKNLKIIGGIKK